MSRYTDKYFLSDANTVRCHVKEETREIFIIAKKSKDEKLVSMSRQDIHNKLTEGWAVEFV
jgi:phosphoribosyl-ATP pyrophosphohydrolase